MHIEPQNSMLASASFPNGAPSGDAREDLRVLLAVASFGQGTMLMRELEFEGYAPNYRMVFRGDHLSAALLHEEWDVMICSADSDEIHLSEILALTASLRSKPLVFIFLDDVSLSAEEAVDLLKAGATNIITRSDIGRFRSSIRRERAMLLPSLPLSSSAPLAFEAINGEQKGLPTTAAKPPLSESPTDDERFRALVQHSRDIISLLDGDFRIIYQSPAYYRLFQFQEQEVRGREALELVHPDDQASVAQALQSVVSAPDAQVTAIFRARTRDGSYRTIEGLATNRLHVSTIRAIVVNARNISEQTDIEGALRESEMQYRTLVENLSEGIIITDSEDIFIFVNPAAEQTFGTGRGELVGRSIQEFVKPETMALVNEQNAERRAGKSGRYELEIIRPNGTKRWQAINSTPRFDDKGVFMGSFVIFNDVTERKNNEEANILFSQFLERRISERTEALKRANAELKHEIAERRRMEAMLLQSGERLNSLLQNSSDVISIVEENGDISYESPASENIFGFEPFERIGKNFLDRVHPEHQESVRSFLHDVIHQPGAIRTIEFLHQSDLKKGYEWVEVTASNQLNNAAVGGIVLNSRDIAARKAAEQELKRALQQEKELNDLKSRFITMVSHEFRTPLTVINSSAEILHLSAGKMSPEKQAMHLERMMASSNRIEQMLNDVLVLARGEAGKTRAVFSPLPLQEFCTEIINELTEATGNEARINLRFTSSAPTHPALDEKLMRSIMTNLLSNALKYSQQAIECTIECTPTYITITVTDKGIGIPIEDQKHMFEAFHRAHNAINIKGTGIGMSIVKYAVDAHEGQIHFTSIENEGTTFVVRLPFRYQSAESAIDRSGDDTLKGFLR